MIRVHLAAWARERFPPGNGVFFGLLYVLALVVGRSAVSGPIVVSWRDLPGFAALWSFFLWLRVLDEHKDFENDRVAHPQRVLQRGLVTLGDLRIVGAAALALQLALSLWIDGGLGRVTTWWLAAFVWSLLMTREFFVRDWLRRHLMWYALSHMVVMLRLVAWVATMGAETAARAPAIWALAALVFASGLAAEMGRKMRAPESEHPFADSYTQALGVRPATLVLAAVVVIVLALTIVTTATVIARVPSWVIGTGVVGLAFALVALGRFRHSPAARSAKRVEAGVGVSILAMHGALLASVVNARSIWWR